MRCNTQGCLVDPVMVSSTGGALDKQSFCLGIYTKTSRTWSGKPVWQSTARDNRFLFYNGDNFHQIMIRYKTCIFKVIGQDGS